MSKAGCSESRVAPYRYQSVEQIMDALDQLYPRMMHAFKSDIGALQAGDTFLALLAQESEALHALEKRMDEAIAADESDSQFDEYMHRIEIAHQRCQQLLCQRIAKTKETTMQLSKLQNRHRVYIEQQK